MTGNSNIASWVADRALSDPHLPAIKQGEMILSYAALDGAASRFATQLAERGVRAGDRVALIMPNVAYFPIAYYAILRLGAVVVPMNPLLKAGEVAYTFDDAGARLAVVFPLFAEEAQAAAASTGTEVLVTVPQEFEQGLSATEPTAEVTVVDPDDTAVLLYTSGTTGQPKGAELSHANLGSNVATTRETLMPNGPGDVLFGGLPLFHSFGQTCDGRRGVPHAAAEVRRRAGAGGHPA
jgi:long-chain acyl-CoA synthetase